MLAKRVGCGGSLWTHAITDDCVHKIILKMKGVNKAMENPLFLLSGACDSSNQPEI